MLHYAARSGLKLVARFARGCRRHYVACVGKGVKGWKCVLLWAGWVIAWVLERGLICRGRGRDNVKHDRFEEGDDCKTLAGMESGIFEQCRVRNIRLVVILLAVLNGALLAGALAVAAASRRFGCPRDIFVASSLVALGSTSRTLWIWVIAFVQVATASTMLAEEREPLGTSATRHKRRTWYRCWLWLSRAGHVVTFLQVAAAANITFVLWRSSSFGTDFYRRHCSGGARHAGRWLHVPFTIVPAAAWIQAVVQCCAGSDVLTWRSLYERRAEAWRAHYREMFDYGIREVLCCLGRSQYMDVLKKEEVDSVASLLGELVAYRAEGPGHLEFLAGVALLHEPMPKPPVFEEHPEASRDLLREATSLHPYAVAAYTGPLLDVGRHRSTFLCAWLYRQGLFTAWNRNRRPSLDGDNWWRGHAAAFLRHVKLPAHALLKGRVCQMNREAVYFVAALHDLQTVVVAVRGTETPEDLITDGLGKECVLSDSDLQGLLKSQQIPDTMKQEIACTSPHFGHIGVVAAARELAMQLDGRLEEDDTTLVGADGSEATIPRYSDQQFLQSEPGWLSSLLAPGGPCDGYSLRFVGHSLGGAIASLTALRLYDRFPSLHVYAYGLLPCLDAATAKACSSFITSIVYNDEFSSRLSLSSIMKLREKALVKLKDVHADSAVVMNLWRCWGSQKVLESEQSCPPVHNSSSTSKDENPQYFRRRFINSLKGGRCLCSHTCRCIMHMTECEAKRPIPKSGSKPIHVPSSYQLMPASSSQLMCNGSLDASPTKELETLVESAEGSACLPGAEDITACTGSDFVGGRTSVCMSEDADGEVCGMRAGGESCHGEDAEGLLSTCRKYSGAESPVPEESCSHVELQISEEPQLFGSMDNTCMAAAVEKLWPAEMFIPGLIIHVICDLKANRRRTLHSECHKHRHRALLRDCSHFRDIVVSPSMFLDHLPWKCQQALNQLVADVEFRGDNGSSRFLNISNSSEIV